MKLLKLVVLFLCATAVILINGCGSSTGSANTPGRYAPTVTVTPAFSSITVAQLLTVKVQVTGSGSTPTGSVSITCGSYTSNSATLSSGVASITIPADSLPAGTDTLTASFVPDTASALNYTKATGSSTITVTNLIPAVVVTPASSTIAASSDLSVTVTLSGIGDTPTGSVVLSTGSYSSASTTLTDGSATIVIPGGTLSAGSVTLTAVYTPDTTSSSIYSSASGSSTITVTSSSAATPTVKVTPASSAITVAQSLSVTVAVSGSSSTPTGTVVLSNGSYTSSSATLSSGSATITIPAGSLASGSNTLTATYTPDTSSKSSYSSGTGSGSVTVSLLTPTVTVTPASTSVASTASLSVTIAVSGTDGTPTGTVVLSSGTYTSSSTTLSSGSATITIPAASLATGSDTLTAVYTPDSASSSIYKSATGTSSAVTVTSSSTTGTSVTVTVDVLANRHTISPYIYGGSYPESAAKVTDSGLSLVRWGGNATSTYNWQLHTYNADADWYWEDFTSEGFSNGDDADSVQFVKDVLSAGSHPLMTMPMLGYVAKAAENSSNGNWSFSKTTWGTQYACDPYNSDACDGLESDGSTAVTTNAVTTAYYPLLDDSSDTCSDSTCVYRNTWAAELSSAFGTGTCSVPYTTITSCHFYDMDNEIDIWGGTHRDIHPASSGYDEMANIYVSEAGKLKGWDTSAVRFGPVSCCWWFYWNGENSADKSAHGGVDFLPWWLNQVYWKDQINGTRTLDVFDVHAYPDVDYSSLSTANKQAAAASAYRDFWDPTYVPASTTINQSWATSIQPNKTIPFRIPRLKALVNAIYPGTPLSFTEWSAEFVSASDFSTALGDADAYGVMGREGMAFASRWEAPVSTNPNYQALKLYTNYDGADSSFGTVSVSDTNTGSASTFASYAALNSAGTTLTVMVINRDPSNTANVTFNLENFSASTYKTYTLSSTASSSIAAASSAAWTATQSFAPYSITLLVISGSQNSRPATEWYLNPDDIMVPASGSTTIKPTISSGSTNVTLSSVVFDAYEGASACSGVSGTINTATVTTSTPGSITLTGGTTAGFCHFTVTGSDGTASQTKGGWLIVGNPAASLTIASGNSQTATAGTTLSTALSVTLSAGSSGGSKSGANILFTTSAGTLTYGTTTGTSVIATTDSSGDASVTLTLPSAKGAVTVTATGQFALGSPTASFTETAN